MKIEYTPCKRCQTEWSPNSIGNGRTWSTDGATIDKCIRCYSPGFESATINAPPLERNQKFGFRFEGLAWDDSHSKRDAGIPDD